MYEIVVLEERNAIVAARQNVTSKIDSFPIERLSAFWSPEIKVVWLFVLDAHEEWLFITKPEKKTKSFDRLQVPPA